MRRRTALPYGQTTSWARLASMLMGLAVLGALYVKLKDPMTWQFLGPEGSVTQVQTRNDRPETTEQLALGPNDQNEEEVRSAERLFEFVTDRAPLKPREMDAYWRMMAWSRTEPFEQLEKRARHDVPFTQLWDQPEKYRGKPIRLTLHLRRVLEFDSPENPSSIPKVYEAWGWTDESRSFPYVVVLSDLPDGLPVGTDVRAEIVFVGYFLKIMSYTAFDHSRGAPLLVGKAQLVESGPSADATKSSDQYGWVIFVGVIIAAGFAAWIQFRPRMTRAIHPLPDQLLSLSDPEAETAVRRDTQPNQISEEVERNIPFDFDFSSPIEENPSSTNSPQRPPHSDES